MYQIVRPRASVETEGDRDVRAGSDSTKRVSAIDRAEAAPHNCHVRDGNTSVTAPLPTGARTEASSSSRSWDELLNPQQFKYRACRRKFYPQFPAPPAMSPTFLQKQRAAVLYGPKDLRCEERTLWPPRQNEAQVKVVATGLCGSDRTYPLRPTRPRTLGCSPTFCQSIIMSTVGTAISPSRHPWSSVTNPLAS